MKRKQQDAGSIFDDKESTKETVGPTCEICFKNLKNFASLRQHMQNHISKRNCHLCEKSYSRLEDLKIHQRKVHNVQQEQKNKDVSLRCSNCFKTFSNNSNLQRHKTIVHNYVPQCRSQFACRHCDHVFENYVKLFHHVAENHSISQTGGRIATAPRVLNKTTDTNENEHDDHEIHKEGEVTEIKPNGAEEEKQPENPEFRDESALRNGVVQRDLFPKNNEKYDLLTFLANVKDKVRAFLGARVKEEGGIKYNVCVKSEMERQDGADTATAIAYFRCRTYFALSVDDIDEHTLNEMMQKIYQSLEKYVREGSAWYLKRVIHMQISSVLYKPVSGSTYVPLPQSLAKSHSILNVQNQDNKCFLYAVLASLHRVNDKPECVTHYAPFEHELNMGGVSYPVAISQIGKVESNNPDISINVFTYEDNCILPLRITNKPQRLHHVNLLWITCGKLSHYCWIRNLNRFLGRSKSHHGCYFCQYCLHGFTREDLLAKHQPYCSTNGPQRVELPIPGENDLLKFMEFNKTLKVCFSIYADFETVVRKVDTCLPNPNEPGITPASKLEVCGFAYKVVSEDQQHTKNTVVYRGQDCATKLIECLLKEQEEIEEILSNIKPMDISPEQRICLIDNAKQCCLCQKLFTVNDRNNKKIVIHHNHLTGKIIGPACNGCNLNCQQAKFTPVIFHNLRNFDAHILCESLGQFKDYRLSCIAQNSERYVGFSLGNLRFLDSYQFLPFSLQTLADDLAKDGVDSFPHLTSEFALREEAELLMHKGIYPYEYMDCFEKFEEKQLPQMKEFYSTISREDISEEDYLHANTVFKKFNMSCMGDYHDLYVKTDVLILADVFESFRNMCMGQYGLDPCQFFTSPGLSWISCLKMTKVELQLLTDIDMVLMVEAGIRGGISQISNRFKKANNKYLDDYDRDEPTSYLQLLDANNLYGWAMVQPLPVGEFEFLKDASITHFDVMKVPENGENGYIVEVSLEYPKELHDLHNCLPLAPEKKVISNGQLSSYAQHLLRKVNGLNDDDPLPLQGKVEKLLTTLEDKDHYIVHYRTLQLYIELGMNIKTIHRVLKFRQEAWMAPYIEHNTEMRKRATSSFQKTLYKLMNVSVFGKTMENVRQHRNIELVHTKKRLKKVSAKATYKNTTIFNEDLVAMECYKAKVELNKPSYSGMCILDLSKCLMYDFWYNYIKKKYGNTAQLQMTDTDSFLFHCETEDIYDDMKSSFDLFDTSDYPEHHMLHSSHNKKVLGKMKDETNGAPISEFVGLRSKMYSFQCDKHICDKNDKQCTGKCTCSDKKCAKGISKVTVKKDIKHLHYKETLFSESSTRSSMNVLRSHGHKLFGEVVSKRGLSAFDDKRYLVNAIESYPYGHFKISENTAADGKTGQENESSSKDNNATMQCVVSDCIIDKNVMVALDADAFMIDDFRVTPCVINW